MIPLNRLKKDVQFNVELTKVVDVLKGIAGARYHVLERQLNLFERYSTAIEEFIRVIDFKKATHPYVRPRSKTTSVVMVTSDAGFLGGLNGRVASVGLKEAGEDGLITVIGDRGGSYVKDAHRDFTSFPGIVDQKRLALAMAVRDHVVKQILEGKCGRLAIVYPKPISFSAQHVTVETFLPCTEWAVQPESQRLAAALLWESRVDDVIEYIITDWIAHRLDEIFALSRLAELSARAVHLEGSYQELLRQGKALKLQYFRSRHEVIDRSMREIYAAQLFCGKEEE